VTMWRSRASSTASHSLPESPMADAHSHLGSPRPIGRIGLAAFTVRRRRYRIRAVLLLAGRYERRALASRRTTSQTGKNRITVPISTVCAGMAAERAEMALRRREPPRGREHGRAVGQTDARPEIPTRPSPVPALVSLTDPRREAEHSASARRPSHRALADLWLAIGDREQAKKHTLGPTNGLGRWAEPYVQRYELNRARALLEKPRPGDPQPAAPTTRPRMRTPLEDEVASPSRNSEPRRKPESREGVTTDSLKQYQPLN